MIIDFHTHVFPNKIAAATISSLAKMGGTTPYSDGTYNGLYSRLNECGISLAINLPVLTKPSQFESVLRFASEINSHGSAGKILSFAGIHPDSEDIQGEMKRIYDSGFLGIKIHPDYQNTYFDDERYVRIISEAKKYGLITVTHAGPDIAYKGRAVRCTPRRVLNLLEKIGGYEKLVLAHLGGGGIYEEVCRELCGRDIYLDTAFSLDFTTKEELIGIVEKHGEDKILFATDSPWADISRYTKYFSSLPVSEQAREKILYKNAKKLLNLK